MSRAACIFSGGHGHYFASTSAGLSEILAGRDFEVHTETDFDVGIQRLGETDLLVVNALRWTMVQHEKYAPFRRAHAFRMAPGRMQRLAGWVREGGRLLAMHTAVICFDTEPEWLNLLGGGWRWGASHHPPRGPLRIAPTGAEAFDLVDEAYHHLSPAADVEILATCDAGEGAQPVAWTRRYGAGRVAVDTLGHDRQSLDTLGHALLIDGLIDWLSAA